MSNEQKRRIELLLAERISPEGICRVLEIRQVVAVHIGDRVATSALGLWQSLPACYRQQATFHTDDWEAYKQIIPVEQHRLSTQKKDTAPAARQSCGAVLL